MGEQEIKKLFSDEKFVSEILDMESPEEVRSALQIKGLDLSLEEIAVIKNSLDSAEEELSEDQLENVAGGFALSAGATALICGLIIGGSTLKGGYEIGKAVNNWTRRRW